MAASTCPAFTLSPTFTSTLVSLPLVVKPTAAELATPTLPEALTLDWTIPRATVAVRWALPLADEPSRKPYTALSATTTTAATARAPSE